MSRALSRDSRSNAIRRRRSAEMPGRRRRLVTSGRPPHIHCEEYRLQNHPELDKALARRRFIQAAGTGTVVLALGGVYVLSDELTREAQAQTRADGRPRLPPGQRVITALRPMGGEPGDPSPSNYRLRVHGEVEAPFELTFAELLASPQSEQSLDVHCVTTWSVLGAKFKGLKVADLAERAKPKKT